MIDFMDVELPDDTVPPLTDVEYPCEVCGKEAGPYAGRGRKPRFCDEHKKGTKNGGASTSRRVTGNAANLAAQATEVLLQLNGILALGAMAIGLNATAATIAHGNDVFAERAHAALLTDTELCKTILKGGIKSAKMGLGIAYGGLILGVAPVAANEIRERRAEAMARRESADI